MVTAFPNVTKRILNWYRKHGRHDLPWKIDPNPYKIWVSEIMLQQTQVKTVICYYIRFLKQYPNILQLSKATLDEVLYLWSGLGYYSRARNLHKTAQEIVKLYQSKFPTSVGELLTLPGIGRSTAGAILSMGYQLPAPILDGNVKRVLCRLHAIPYPTNLSRTQNILWALSEQYTPLKNIGDYTQAIMDLGSLLCTRNHPKCLECPLKSLCIAYKTKSTLKYPIPYAKPKKPTRDSSFLLIKQGKNTLLIKNPNQGIWGGLWTLPELPSNQDVRKWCSSHSLPVKQIYPLPTRKHSFTHFHLNLVPWLIILRKKQNIQIPFNNWIWYKSSFETQVGLAAPIQKLLISLQETYE